MLVACKDRPTPVVVTTFEIEVTDVDTTSAFVTVTPSDTNTWYYYDAMPVEFYQEYENADELAADYIAWIEDEVAYCQEYGLDYVFEDWLSQGTDSYLYEELISNTEYVAFAFAVDTFTHAKVGPFYHKNFTTLGGDSVPNEAPARVRKSLRRTSSAL